MKKNKKPIRPERDYRKEMLTGKFYNERRVKGYNHLTGWLDDFRPGKCNELAMEPYKVNNLIIVE